MVRRPLGRTGLQLSPIGFGAFKIGRNQGIKYPRGYELPSEQEVHALIHGLIDLGINYIDTAPAYVSSEERLGKALADHPQRDRIIISTKVGENFAEGQSTYDFSDSGVTQSLARSRQRLGRDVLDLVLVHSSGDDLAILESTNVVSILKEQRSAGAIRAIGISGKTVVGAVAALSWADAIMVEYHLGDRSHEAVIEEAGRRGVGVIVKKGLSAGRLHPPEAIAFVLSNRSVTSMVIGGLNLQHFKKNVHAATDRPRR